MQMKALTIYQPYASLIAVGTKRFETRSRRTNYRGRIAIHAGVSQAFLKTEVNTEAQYRFLAAAQKALGPGGLLELSYGAIIATAELVGCHRITTYADDTPCLAVAADGSNVPIKSLQTYRPKQITGDELLFGDWTPGRFAWELADVKLLDEPIPCRGQQGLWNAEFEGLKYDDRPL